MIARFRKWFTDPYYYLPCGCGAGKDDDIVRLFRDDCEIHPTQKVKAS